VRPYSGLTYGRLVEAAAEARGDAIYVVDMPAAVRLSFRQFAVEVRRLAAALLAAGVKPGDRVAILSENTWRYPVVQYAAPAIGAWFVNLHASLQPNQLAGILDHCEPSLVLVQPGGRHDLASSLRSALALRPASGVRTVVLGEEGEFLTAGESIDPEQLDAAIDAVDLDDINIICYTGGTTGSPRGVLRTHHNMVNHPRIFVDSLELTSDDVHCTDYRYWHTAGMDGGTSLALNAGCRLVIPSPTFDAGATLCALVEERCTVYSAVPASLQKLLDHPEYDPDKLCLRSVICGAAHSPPHLTCRLKDELGVHICGAYGSTETGVFTVPRRSDDSDLQTTTVGRAAPSREVRVVDPATNRTVPRGTPGEVCARGLLMSGYHRDPEASRRRTDGAGWFHSGDIGIMRDDGALTILGRLDDMIIRGGENVFPAEIKAALREHPAVLEAEVVGVRDPVYGSEIAAWVRAEGDVTTDELITHCRARLAFYQVPRWIFFADSLPVTGPGKPDLNALRRMAEERLATP
jgi:fatty-acyl-CoA synthase